MKNLREDIYNDKSETWHKAADNLTDNLNMDLCRLLCGILWELYGSAYDVIQLSLKEKSCGE